jgi:hypothetical protein
MDHDMATPHTYPSAFGGKNVNGPTTPAAVAPKKPPNPKGIASFSPATVLILATIFLIFFLILDLAG